MTVGELRIRLAQISLSLNGAFDLTSGVGADTAQLASIQLRLV